MYDTRRSFLRNGSLFLLGTTVDWNHTGQILADDSPVTSLIRVGMVTDLHYADKPSRGSRYYRETLAKLEEASLQFEKENPDLVVELGDLIDAADSLDAELSNLKRIHKEFASLPGKKHYVLGNHCVDNLRKEEFLDGIGQQDSFYSFDEGGVHFVVLDSCFRSDGIPYGRKNFQWTDPNIPTAEVDWLLADLKSNNKPVIVFAHQRLDVSNGYGVKNSAQVRKILEDSHKVLAVFQGHSHKNDHIEINGIHYCTLVAMVEGSGVENNGYSMMEVFEGGVIRLSGFRSQSQYEWQ